MNKFLMSIVLASAIVPVAASPALAQSRDTREAARELREQHRDLREARRDGDRRDIRREQRDVRRAERDLARNQQRDWRTYRNYDFNRFERGRNAYYANDYYRDGRQYRERRLAANDRVYRGNDGRYYCRRDDGTTGLIIGALGGGVLGNIIAPGDSKLLGTILGGGAGALLGRSIDRDNVRCR